MKRRMFVASAAVATLLPGTAAFASSLVIDYTREKYEKALASGNPVLLDFSSES